MAGKDTQYPGIPQKVNYGGPNEVNGPTQNPAVPAKIDFGSKPVESGKGKDD